MNTETDIQSATENPWLRTSPAAILFFLGKLIRGLIDVGWAMLVAGYGIIKSGNSDYLILIGALLLLAMAVWSVLSWLRFRYRLEGDRMMVKRGVIHLEQLTIEFARVQKTRVLEPFYLRPFRLALFEVDTAGSARQEVTLGGIAIKLARSLRDSIVARQQIPDDADADADVEATVDVPVDTADNIILTRSNKDIALYGLTHNGMFWFVAVMAAVFSQAGQSETWDMTRIIAGFFNFELWSNLQIGLAIFGVLLMLPLLSIIGSFWRYFGYRLHRDDDTWRRHSGLVSKHDESIKQHKIQSIIWQQNVVARALGRINLRLKQTSAGVAVDHQGTGQKKQPAFIIPALLPADAEQLTGQLLPHSACLDTRFSRADRRYIYRLVLWGWSLPGVLIALLVAQAWDWRGLLIWPVVIAIGTLVMTQCWRRLGYAVRGEYGLIRKGFLGSRISVFPLFKVQRVDIRQTPNQRKRGLAHLTIHLASHSLTLPWIRLADAHQFRDLALYHVETSTQRWY